MNNTKKTVRIISSPGTEYEVIKDTSIYAPNDELYFLPEGVTFERTQEQSLKYIESLEKQLSEAQRKLDDILDIVNPDRYEEK